MKEPANKAAALRYRQGIDAAPSVIAKGKGAIAEQILALAREHGIPIREDRNMVEILSAIDLYEEIPAELYKAVAEILAYLYKMSGRV